MGVNTTIFVNHNFIVPSKSNEIVELLKETWSDRIEVFNKIEVESQNLTSDPKAYKVFINPKLIEFEFERFKQITISTNFNLIMNMRLHKKSLCITPIGIGRFATNMIVEFMNQPFGIYINDSDSFNQRKKAWKTFKIFLNRITHEIGGNKHLYLNDGKLEGIADLALDGKTIDEMIIKAEEITRPCLTAKQFVDNHTWLRNDGIRDVKDDIWFAKESIN